MSLAEFPFCCDRRRRAAVSDAHPAINGIDFVEVLDADAPPGLRQRLLRVHFLRAAPALTPEDVHISGGERIREVAVTHVRPDSRTPADPLVREIQVAAPGDFSTYLLSLADRDGDPLPGIDPLLATTRFTFKVECPSDADCAPACGCAPAPREDPLIDYLAKDYEGFRRLMLDRMALIAPGWTERNPADMGVTLVELVAYVADHLSYRQDAAAGEAYLGTARRRSSVRRHAALLDYRVSDGCNARVWVHVPAARDGELARGTALATRVPGLGQVVTVAELSQRAGERPEIFETMHPLALRTGRDRIAFHVWGERECCLPAGATGCWLRGGPRLAVGDLLLLEEEIGARTGTTGDADRDHRHVVRLTAVEARTGADPLEPALTLTEVRWGDEDALPFPLCLSARAEDGRHLPDVAVARANIVLADHGGTVDDPDWPGLVPDPDPALAPRGDTCGPCGDEPPAAAAVRFRPALDHGPVTQVAHVARTIGRGGSRERQAFDPEGSATSAYRFAPERVLPAISLTDDLGRRWLPQQDLLSSDASQREFVLEPEDAVRATLRFGDGENAESPAPGRTFGARYRVGNGVAGNVGAGAIAHVVSDAGDVADRVAPGVRNPLPARGGVDPEDLERVRQDAPVAFRRPERAVTADDYAQMAERSAEVQRAQATLRWTGSWRTVFLSIDRPGGLPVDADFERRLRAHLERYRLAGHDLEIDGPRYADLEVELAVCADPAYFRGDVGRAVRDRLGSGTLTDGTRAFFHPDNLTFDQDVRLGPIVAAAQAVPGVREVRPRVFRRLGARDEGGLLSGVVEVGRLEIARLADDPSFPDRGVLRLDMSGGR